MYIERDLNILVLVVSAAVGTTANGLKQVYICRTNPCHATNLISAAIIMMRVGHSLVCRPGYQT